MAKIKNIIIHCSASSFGNKEIINEWHIERGFREIGYNFVILNGKEHSNKPYDNNKDGLIEIGRNIDHNDELGYEEIGAHAKGFNANSIGICLIGEDKFTLKQFETLIYFCKYWKNILPDVEIIGHYMVNAYKSCPNFNIEMFKILLNNINIDNNIWYYFKQKLQLPG